MRQRPCKPFYANRCVIRRVPSVPRPGAPSLGCADSTARFTARSLNAAGSPFNTGGRIAPTSPGQLSLSSLCVRKSIATSSPPSTVRVI